jgi:hypothetical protein
MTSTAGNLFTRLRGASICAKLNDTEQRAVFVTGVTRDPTDIRIFKKIGQWYLYVPFDGIGNQRCISLTDLIHGFRLGSNAFCTSINDFCNADAGCSPRGRNQIFKHNWY